MTIKYVTKLVQMVSYSSTRASVTNELIHCYVFNEVFNHVVTNCSDNSQISWACVFKSTLQGIARGVSNKAKRSTKFEI